MEQKLIKHITPELSLYMYNQIPVLQLQHTVGRADIALQGAHLLSWTPAQAKQDVLWLSEIEPFILGNAIRGGIPICYPWFGAADTPAHGYARIRLWQLSDYIITDEKVRLEFSLFSEHHLIEAKLNMEFSHECQLTLTHYGTQPAQAALHSYFNISNIEHVSVHGLPTSCFNKLSHQQENVFSPRQINENVDCIYHTPAPLTLEIVDPIFKRNIEIEQLDATDTILWNPWHKTTSGMSEQGYRNMVCVETAKIDCSILQGERLSARLSLK